MPASNAKHGAPRGIRTLVPALRGLCPRPLDDGSVATLHPAGARKGAGIISAHHSTSSGPDSLDQQNDRVPTPVIVARADHPVSRRMISGNALKVLYRLKEGGYQAFLVGGCVRDLLIGIEPKDFDVATDASPEEMRRLFRNCRLIGRRFRLAHVRFGQQVIEVATFRAAGVPMVPEGIDDADGEPDVTEAAAEGEPDPAGAELNRSTACTMTAGGCCATTSTARSTRTCGAATSPAMRSTTTSRTSRSGTTSAASRTSARARSA